MFKFETLDIWVESIDFTKEIYTATRSFPLAERFALSDQLRRAASSVPANIAEGSGGSTNKDFSHFLDISIKSIYEVVSHLYIAEQQGYISMKKRKEIYDKAEILVKRIKSFKRWLNSSQ